jgi:hypothetical protein
MSAKVNYPVMEKTLRPEWTKESRVHRNENETFR